MKRGTPRHPKIFNLLEALDLPTRQISSAIGYLELLWHFTAEFSPQGDVGKFTDDSIENAMEWWGRQGDLIEAMVASGWIDQHPEHRLIVHDWHDHADSAVRQKLKCMKKSFVTKGLSEFSA